MDSPPPVHKASEPVHYARSPLIEAVIELRLAEDLPEPDFKKLEARYTRLKWKAEKLIEFEFTLGPKPTTKEKVLGFKFTSAEGTDVFQLRRNAFSASRLPPYESWEAVVDSFMTHWRPFRKVAGRRQLARVGVRYINRFDFPTIEQVDLEKYFAFNMNKPALLDEPASVVAMQLQSGIVGANLKVMLGLQLVPSPLIDHVAVVLDLDIYREVDVPQSDHDILVALAAIRSYRTQIFESCITDATRAMIS